MSKIEMLIESFYQHLTDTQNAQNRYFSTIGLKYAYGQIQL